MSSDIADRTRASSQGRFAQALVLAQLLFALGGMLAFIFAPRADEPVALYPLSESAARTLPAIMTEPGSLILGRGLLADSYIVRGSRPGFLESLLSDGVLILNASAPGCGPVPADAIAGAGG